MEFTRKGFDFYEEAVLHKFSGNLSLGINKLCACLEIEITDAARSKLIKTIAKGRVYRLKPITQKTRSLWFKALEALIVSVCGKSPAKNPVIAEIGKSGADKYYRTLAKGNEFGGNLTTEISKLRDEGRAKKSRDSNIWHAARGQLKTAFNAILKEAWREPPSSSGRSPGAAKC